MRLNDSSSSKTYPSPPIIFEKSQLQTLIDLLQQLGYTVVGPTIRDGAIIYDTIASLNDLPQGVVDEQGPGTYRLREGKPGAYFQYTVGPQAWKKFLHPPQLQLWKANRTNGDVHIELEKEPPPRYAFLGVRACELAAIHIYDRVFAQGPYVDPYYLARRQGTFIVAVNCTRAGNTCFCASMNTGPAVNEGADIVLTELEDAFLAWAGTDRGRPLLESLEHREASPEEIAQAQRLVQEAASHMGRSVDTSDVHDLLLNNLEHPLWEEVAKRCLTCTNCTMVCPTCFCFTIEDVTDLAGTEAARVRKWDSCFSMEFTYVNGFFIRRSAAARYRQWLTHKFAGWVDQFGTFGCVGCGRCITWCPVGIDVTEEIAKLRQQAITNA